MSTAALRNRRATGRLAATALVAVLAAASPASSATAPAMTVDASRTAPAAVGDQVTVPLRVTAPPGPVGAEYRADLSVWSTSLAPAPTHPRRWSVAPLGIAGYSVLRIDAVRVSDLGTLAAMGSISDAVAYGPGCRREGKPNDVSYEYQLTLGAGQTTTVEVAVTMRSGLRAITPHLHVSVFNWITPGATANRSYNAHVAVAVPRGPGAHRLVTLRAARRPDHRVRLAGTIRPARRGVLIALLAAPVPEAFYEPGAAYAIPRAAPLATATTDARGRWAVTISARERVAIAARAQSPRGSTIASGVSCPLVVGG